jgi:uncharacterized protein (TIGR00266 family)
LAERDDDDGGGAMKTTIDLKPMSAIARVELVPGETLTAQSGAMIAMSNGIQVETTTRKKGAGGGMWKAVKRMLAGESLFLNHFTAREPGFVIVAPFLPGDIVEHPVGHGALIVQGSSWLASTAGVDVDGTFAGFKKALFSGESMFWVKLTGQGTALLASFGAIFPIEVDGEYVVDTGNVVAFDDTLSFDIGLASESIFGSFMGGEGFVCKFKGRGRVLCQTHQPHAFGVALRPHLKPRQA